MQSPLCLSHTAKDGTLELLKDASIGLYRRHEQEGMMKKSVFMYGTPFAKKQMHLTIFLEQEDGAMASIHHDESDLDRACRMSPRLPLIVASMHFKKIKVISIRSKTVKHENKKRAVMRTCVLQTCCHKPFPTSEKDKCELCNGVL